MRIFLVGDFTLNNGPAIANRFLLKGFNKSAIYSKRTGKITRIIELIFKIMISDAVCFCSYSKLNIIGVKISKLFNKKSFYIMHGYKTYETKVNSKGLSQEEINEINKEERLLFKNIDEVYCVSKKFMEFMRIKEPEFYDKFNYNYNPVDLLEMNELYNKNKKPKNINQIVSVGGGLKQKNILVICEAINILNEKHGLKLKFIVIGKPYTEKNKICSYNFVRYYNELPHEKVIDILCESNLYIQNSSLETFGITTIEALICRCALLVSKNIGANDLLDTLNEDDTIFDTKSIDELVNKIKWVVFNNNNSRLMSGFNKEKVYLHNSVESLKSKMLNHL